MRMKLWFDYKKERRYIIVEVYSLWEILTCIEEQTKGEEQ